MTARPLSSFRPSSPSASRLGGFCLSILIHAAAITTIASMPSTVRVLREPEVPLFTAEQKRRIIWYSFRKDLPRVSPGRNPRTVQVPRGSSRQAILVKGNHPGQFVRTPDPSHLAPPPTAPNLVEVAAPALAATPKLKPFQPPPPAQPKLARATGLLKDDAPAIDYVPKASATAGSKPSLSEELIKPQPLAPQLRPFQPPPPAQPKSAKLPVYSKATPHNSITFQRRLPLPVPSPA